MIKNIKILFAVLLCALSLICASACKKSDKTIENDPEKINEKEKVKTETKAEVLPDESLAEETFKNFADSIASYNFGIAGTYTDDKAFFDALEITDEKSYVRNFRLSYGAADNMDEQLVQKLCDGYTVNEYKTEIKQISLQVENERKIIVQAEITYPDIAPVSVYKRKAQEIILSDFYTMCTLMNSGTIKEGMSKEEVLSCVSDSVYEKAEQFAVNDLGNAEICSVEKTFELNVKDGKWVINSEPVKALQQVNSVELDENYYDNVQKFIDSYEQRAVELTEASGVVKKAFDALLELRLVDSEQYFKSDVRLFDSMEINSVSEASDLAAKEVTKMALEEISKKGFEVSEECVYDPVNKKVNEIINKLLEKSEYRITDSRMLENGNVEFEVYVKMPDFDGITELLENIDMEKLVGDNLSSLTNVGGYIGTLIGAVSAGKDPVESVVSNVANDLCNSVAKDITALELSSNNYVIQLEKTNGTFIVCKVETK